MTIPIVLASGSVIRAQLLTNANIDFVIHPVRIDEDSVRKSMLAEGATPRDIADTLAEMKARKASDKHPQALVLGCDQVLDFQGRLLSKPATELEALEQLKMLRNNRHHLLSAAVLYEQGKPVWRHVGQVRLRMRDASDRYIESYVKRNWQSIRHSVGAYKLEEEGVRLFSGIDGDYFNVLGMPLLELINFLALKGIIEK